MGTGRKRLKKGIRWAALILAAFVLLSMAATHLLFRALFGRSEKAADALELRIEDVDRTRYPCRSVSFPSGGALLRGYLFEGGREGLIILISGAAAGAETHLAEALYFADHGWSALVYDGTGVRASGGSGTLGLPQSKRDVLAAVDYAAAEPSLAGLPIILYGHSNGAYAAATALESEAVSGAVCIAGFDSAGEMMLSAAYRAVGVLACAGYPFMLLENLALFGPDAGETAVEAINAAGKPVLIIQGLADETVPEEISIYGRREAVTNPKASWLPVAEAGRNGHNTVWLSPEAAAYVQQCRTELAALEPAEVPAYVAGVDLELAHRLDEAFMEQVLEFCAAAAA